MSKKGENIYKRKDNRWEGRYIRFHDFTGKAKYGYVYGKTYKEAKEKLAAAKNQNGIKPKEVKKNFAFYCDEWLVLHRNRVKESTYVKYYIIINNHLKPQFGELLPKGLNTVVVEQFTNKMITEKNLSNKTVKDILTVMNAVIKYISRVSDSGFTGFEIVYPKENNQEIRVLTAHEQKNFAEYLLKDTDNVKFGILLALLTGMRIGELCALRWSDISVENKILCVDKTMQRLKNLDESESKTKIVINEAKTRKSKRIIPLNGQAAYLCQQRKPANPNAFVLTGREDKYMEPRALQYRLSVYTKELGLKDVHFHCLRHTFATRCVEVGFEIKSLSEILGHSSSKVTLDRYVHSSLELKRVNMEKLTAVGL
ncbi:MAG: site-specific integrase [Clostridia bacterium]|nr:site-specific integrase [Clostridia bacterium]